MKDEDIIFEPETGDTEGPTLREPLAVIKKLKDKLKRCEEERGEYLDGWQRMKADLANYKKDEERRTGEMRAYATEELLVDLLRVEESFQIAFTNKEAWERVDEGWRKGVEYIHSQFLTVLQEHGLSVIAPKCGEPFNPREQHSIGTVPTENQSEDDLIREVVKNGYRLNDKVIKPAEVRVAHYISTH